MLKTKKKFSKQEILETIYLLASRDIDQIIDLLSNPEDKTEKNEGVDSLFSWLEKIEDGPEDTDSVEEHDVIQ